MWLKIIEIILSQFGRLDAYNQVVGRAWLSLKTLQEESFLVNYIHIYNHGIYNFTVVPANLVLPCLVDALVNVCHHLHMAFSPVCLCTDFPLFIRITILGVGPYPKLV